jgi:hypothetical protein
MKNTQPCIIASTIVLSLFFSPTSIAGKKVDVIKSLLPSAVRGASEGTARAAVTKALENTEKTNDSLAKKGGGKSVIGVVNLDQNAELKNVEVKEDAYFIANSINLLDVYGLYFESKQSLINHGGTVVGEKAKLLINGLTITGTFLGASANNQSFTVSGIELSDEAVFVSNNTKISDGIFAWLSTDQQVNISGAVDLSSGSDVYINTLAVDGLISPTFISKQRLIIKGDMKNGKNSYVSINNVKAGSSK